DLIRCWLVCCFLPSLWVQLVVGLLRTSVRSCAGDTPFCAADRGRLRVCVCDRKSTLVLSMSSTCSAVPSTRQARGTQHQEEAEEVEDRLASPASLWLPRTVVKRHRRK
ncbi:unnamed protein product, partial [Ectocarpus sp. 8 AP-2014]